MIITNDLNTLCFSREIDDIYNNYFKLRYSDLWISDIDDFPYFELDLSEYNELDLNNISITLVNINNSTDIIDFKNIIDYSDLLYTNYRLIYRSKEYNPLTVDLLGCYYIDINIGGDHLYSNYIRFKEIGFIKKTKSLKFEYTTTIGANIASITLGNEGISGTINIDWGDGNDEDLVLDALDEVITNDYGTDVIDTFTITISGELYAIQRLKFDDLKVKKAYNFNDLTNLIYLNMSDSGISTIDLLSNNNIIEVDFEKSKISDISKLNENIKTITLTQCTSLVDLENSLNRLINIEYFYALDCRGFFNTTKYIPLFSNIKHIDLTWNSQNSDPFPFKNTVDLNNSWELLEYLNLSRCMITSLPNMRNNYQIFINGTYYDYSYNQLSTSYVDTIIELILINNINKTTGVEIKLNGFNIVSPYYPMSPPSHRIYRTEVIDGGLGISEGTIFNATVGDASIIVTDVFGPGEVQEVEILNAGTDYNVNYALFTHASGLEIRGFSAKYDIDNTYTNVDLTTN